MNKMLKVIKLVAILSVIFVVANTAEAKTLTVGSSGSEVVSLQTWLISNGYPIPLIENGRASKGYFGTQTKDAVTMYQEERGLPMTGYIDSESYNSLKFGSVTGPDLYSPYWNVNNVRDWYYSSATVAASTTCSFKSPNATTTLLSATQRYNVIASSTILEIGHSTALMATTTLIARNTVATTDSFIGVVASTTGASALTNMIVNPNTYINFKMGAGATAGTVTPVGMCRVVLREV